VLAIGLARCKGFGLAAMRRLSCLFFPTRIGAMCELEEAKFRKIYENLATGIALAKLDGFFEERMIDHAPASVAIFDRNIGYAA
jgi:hypothetical protein